MKKWIPMGNRIPNSMLTMETTGYTAQIDYFWKVYSDSVFLMNGLCPICFFNVPHSTKENIAGRMLVSAHNTGNLAQMD